MTKEMFQQLIESPAINEKDNLQKIYLKGTIARTIRLTLEYPECAKVYYEDLPKVANEYHQPNQSDL